MSDESTQNYQSTAIWMTNLMTPQSAKKLVGHMLLQSDESTVRATLHLLENLLADPNACRQAASPDLWLVATGEKKIQVIKVIREMYSAELKSAKEAADSAPVSLTQVARRVGWHMADPRRVADQLRAVGAVVEIR